MILQTNEALQIEIAERKRAEEQVRHNLERIRALHEIDRAITSTLDLGAVLNVLLEKIDLLLPYSVTTLRLLNKESGLVEAVAARNIDEKEWKTTMREGGRGFSGGVLKSKSPVIIANVQKHTHVKYPEFLRKYGLISYVGLPLVAKDETLGTLGFYTKEEHQFTNEEVEFLSALADRAAIAIHNSQLFEQVEKRTKELSALQAVMTAASKSLHLDTVLQEVIKKITEVFYFDSTGIFLFDLKEEELHLRAFHTTEPMLFAQITTFRRGQGTVGTVGETGEPLIFEDIHTDLRYQELSMAKLVEVAGLSFLAVFPVKIRGKCVGTIVCVGKDTRRLTPGETQLIMSMTDQIGVAVENATLFKKTQADARELSALYTVSSTVNNSLDLDVVLQEVIEKINGIFDFNTVRIYLFNPEVDGFNIRASFPPNRDDLSRVKLFRPGQGVVGKVGESGEPLVFEDTQTDPRYREMSHSKNTLRTGHRFLAAFPIKTKFKCVGTIICNGKAPRSLLSDEIRLLASMGEQIGIAVENAHLYEETKKQALQLENEIIERKQAEKERARLFAETKRNLEHISALYSVTATVSESLHLNTILQEVIKKITEVFHFDATRIFLFDPPANELNLRASFETHPEFFAGVRVFRRGQGLVGRVADTGEALVFEDVLSDPRYQELSYSKLSQKGKFSFFGGFPIKVKKRLIGVMVCIGKDARRLTPDERRLIISMADQIGVAVENANLFQETVSRARELSALYSISTVVNKSLDLDSILSDVMHDILGIFHFDAARIYLFDEDRNELCLKFHLGFPKDINPPASYKPGQGFIGRVFETGEPILFDDIQNSPEFRRQSSRKTLLRAGFHGHFSIPIGVKGSTVGVMNFVSKRPHHFSSGENQLIHSIANHVGISVENARLYEHTKNQALQLEEELTERKRAEAQLKEASAELARRETALRDALSNLKAAQLQLIQAEKLESIGRLAAGVAHEVKNPLAIMLQGIHYLSKHLTTNGDNVTMALQDMDNAVKRADSVVKGLLDFSAPSELSLNTEELNSVVEQSLSLVRHELDKYHVKAVKELSEDLPPVRLDRNKMEQVFVNVFLNAVHAMPKGGTLTVKTYAKQLTEVSHDLSSRIVDPFRIGETVVMAEVEDTGTGIPGDQLSEVFDPFFTTKSTGKGTGLGLTVTKKIIELHGGTIDIGNRKEEGVRATIMFKARGGKDHE